MKVEVNLRKKVKLNIILCKKKISSCVTYLPLTVVYLITSPGRTTDNSISLSITFSFCSMMRLVGSVLSNGEIAMDFVSDGGGGALDFLLK